MAEYVVVDKAKLNSDLETIGNAIRTQTDKTAKLHFPEELEREILSIVKAKPEQEKTVEVTENGTVEVTPDLGKVLSKIIANVNVASSGGGGGSAEIFGMKVETGSITRTETSVSSHTIEHNLGVKPSIVIVYTNDDIFSKGDFSKGDILIGGISVNTNIEDKTNTKGFSLCAECNSQGSVTSNIGIKTDTQRKNWYNPNYTQATRNTLYINAQTTSIWIERKLSANVTYNYILMG